MHSNLISKCNWLVLVLTSGYFALTESAFLFSRAFESSLASKGEIAHRVGAPQGFWCGKVPMWERQTLHYVECRQKLPALSVSRREEGKLKE